MPELKVTERTRLAVEQHDALSQTLTGVSMQIDTAGKGAKVTVVLPIPAWSGPCGA